MKKIEKKKLEELYKKHSVRKIAEMLNVTKPTIYALLDEAKIPRKGLKKYKVV